MLEVYLTVVTSAISYAVVCLGATVQVVSRIDKVTHEAVKNHWTEVGSIQVSECQGQGTFFVCGNSASDCHISSYFVRLWPKSVNIKLMLKLRLQSYSNFLQDFKPDFHVTN